MALGTTDISTALVKDVLGETTNNVGGLCTSAKINKWSRWKPIISSIILTEQVIKNNNAGLSIPFGTNIGLATIPGTLIYLCHNNLFEWVYNKPTGGQLAPYRIGDFRNYEHVATPLLGSVPSITIWMGTSNTITIDVEYNIASEDTKGILWSTLNVGGVALSECYMGILLVDTTTPARAFYATTSTKVGNIGGGSVVIPFSTPYLGTYHAYIFLSSVITDWSQTAQAGIYVPVDVPKGTVIIQSMAELHKISVVAEWATQLNASISYSVTLQNNGTVAYTFTDIYVLISRTTGTTTAAEGEVMRTTLIAASRVVAAGQSVTLSGTIIINRESGYIYWAGGRATGVSTVWTGIGEAIIEA